MKLHNKNNLFVSDSPGDCDSDSEEISVQEQYRKISATSKPLSPQDQRKATTTG